MANHRLALWAFGSAPEVEALLARAGRPEQFDELTVRQLCAIAYAILTDAQSTMEE